MGIPSKKERPTMKRPELKLLPVHKAGQELYDIVLYRPLGEPEPGNFELMEKEDARGAAIALAMKHEWVFEGKDYGHD
jgi:hypothetical protein